jgi:hypothetical protein
MTSSEDDEAHSVLSYMLPQRSSLNSMQKKKLEKRLRAICSQIHIYACVMKKTNVSEKYLAMSELFVLKFQRLCKGRPRFAGDNNLQLCLFELLKTKKYTMNESNIEIL